MWRVLERRRAARFPGARGRIPNFVGAEAAAALLAEQEEWSSATTVKANPDAPQLPVRARALAEGKTLFMAVSRLRTPEPFLLLDPRRVRVPARRAVSIRGAAAAGRPVSVSELPRIDLVVCGSVAVDRRGARVGKGGGYSDLELALLVEAGAVDGRTVVATTVHPIQVLEEDVPETGHDFRVDLVVTPQEAFRPPRQARRRAGIVWSDLDEDRIQAIPALAALRREG